MADMSRVGAALILVAIAGGGVYALLQWLGSDHLLAGMGLFTVFAAGVLLIAYEDGGRDA